MRSGATSIEAIIWAIVRYDYSMNDELTAKPQSVETLYGDVCQIIDGARSRIATYLNTEVCMTNWCVGKRIKEDVLFNQRAEYGKQVIKNLSARLTERYGRGWSEKHLRHCLRSAETFSEEEIVSATQRQLTWTHLKTLVYVKDPLERQFYVQMCGMEHWDTRTLDEQGVIVDAIGKVDTKNHTAQLLRD